MLRSGWKTKPYGHMRQLQWIEKSCSESGSSESYDDHLIYTTLNDINFPDLENEITDLSDDPYLDIKLEETCTSKIGSVLKEIKQLRGCEIFDLKKPEFSDSDWDEGSSADLSVSGSTSDSASTLSREPLFPGLPPLPRPTPKAPPPTPTDGQRQNVGECGENNVLKKSSSTGDFGISYPSNSFLPTFGKQPFIHLKSISSRTIMQGKEENVAAKSKKNCLVVKDPQEMESRFSVSAEKLAAEKEASISHLIDKLKSRQNLTQEVGRGNILAKTTKPNPNDVRRTREENYARLDGLLARPELRLKAKETVPHPQKLIVRTAPSNNRLSVNTSRATIHVERPYTYGRFRKAKE